MELPSSSPVRSKKTWIVLGIALAVGLLAAVAANTYLTGRMAEIEGRAMGKTKPLIVAKAALVKGDKISSDNVAVRSVPEDFAHSNAYNPNQFEKIEGQELAFDVQPGELILASLLKPRKPPTFSTRIQAGRRAITVAVDEISSISGMLEPGDLIDLFFTQNQGGKKQVIPLLQRLQVLATGQRTVDDPKSGERKTYSTVTLNASAAEAQDLITAQSGGQLTALLRNPQDTAPLVLPPDAGKDVPVMYGGQSAKLPPEALRMLASTAAANFQANQAPQGTAPNIPGAQTGQSSQSGPASPSNSFTRR